MIHQWTNFSLESEQTLSQQKKNSTFLVSQEQIFFHIPLSNTRLEYKVSQLPLGFFFFSQPARKQPAERLFCGAASLGTPEELRLFEASGAQKSPPTTVDTTAVIFLLLENLVSL